MSSLPGNKKQPLSFRLVQWLFPKLESLLPYLARKWAVQLFFRPIPFSVPEGESAVLEYASAFHFSSGGKLLQGFEWGKGDKVVLTVHGWSGRGTQFQHFITTLVEKGYKVVSFDAPAHGKSPGKSTDALEISQALTDLANLYENIHAVIGHSLGGVTLMLACNNGFKPNRIALICVPSIAEDIKRNFLEKVNGSEQTGEYLDRYIQKKYNKSLVEISGLFLAKNIRNIPTLLIYDEDDHDVPVNHGQELHDTLGSSRLMITEGLGHTKILKDEKVVNEVVKFIGQE